MQLRPCFGATRRERTNGGNGTATGRSVMGVPYRDLPDLRADPHRIDDLHQIAVGVGVRVFTIAYGLFQVIIAR